MHSFVRRFLIAAAFLQCQWPNFDCQTTDIRLDVFIVLKGSMLSYKSEFNAVNQTLSEFPKVFPMGDDKVRVALLIMDKTKLPTGHTEYLSYTSNFAGFDARMQQIWNDVKPKESDDGLATNLHPAFRDLRPHKERSLMIFAVTTRDITELDEAKKEAKLLRDAGVWLYITTDVPAMLPEIAEMTGSENRRFYATLKSADGTIANNFTKEILEKIYADIADQCAYEETCLFQDAKREQCKSQWWYPKDDSKACDNIRPTPTPTKQCEERQCNEACDDNLGKFGDCGECGTAVKRSGSSPKTELGHCLLEKPCPCPTTTDPSTLPPWAIVLIVLGAVALLAVAAVVAFVLRGKSNAKAKKKPKASKKKMAVGKKGKVKGKAAKTPAPTTSNKDEEEAEADEKSAIANAEKETESFKKASLTDAEKETSSVKKVTKSNAPPVKKGSGKKAAPVQLKKGKAASKKKAIS